MGIKHTEATERQIEILDFISKYYRENCCSPSLRDIASNFGFSVKGAYDHVHALERKGYIKKTGHARAILVLKGDRMKVSRPMLRVVLYCKIEKESERFYISTFPDYPSVQRFGTSRDDSIAWAKDALEGCLGRDIDRGYPIPEAKYIGDDDCRIEVHV